MTKNRYSRNILTIGAEAQDRLALGSVFIIGCGALGGHTAMLLAGAGVGRIGIADFDTVDISNLQRQLYFSESEAGEYKVGRLASRMRALNSEIKVEEYRTLIRRDNAREILGDYDFIIDATDNPATKYLIDDLCLEIGKPGCIGGVAGWRGQVVSVCGCKDGERTMRFGDIFPCPDADPSMLPCEIEGVIGAAASIISSVQASEAIKYLTGEGEMLFNKAYVMNLKDLSFDVLSFEG